MDYYKNLFLSVRDAVMTISPPDWKFTSANPATVRMFGAKNEADFLSYEPWSLSPKFQPDGQLSSDKAKIMIAQAVTNGSNFFPWVHKRINGEEFSAEVFLSRVGDGDEFFIHALVRDISDRVILEEKLNKRKKEQEIILDSIPSWIFYKDDKNNFVWVNQSFAKVMNLPKEKIEGRNMIDFYPREQSEAYAKDDQEVILSGLPKRNIIERMDSSSGTLWVQTDKIPYRNEEGKIIGVIGFSLDITERKEFEDNLKQSNQDLERLNKLMVGRELEMIKLKEELKKINDSRKIDP